MSDPSDGGCSDGNLPRGDRLSILSFEDLGLWARPRFARRARGLSTLDARETTLLQRLRTARTRTHSLQLGYFRARQRFSAALRDKVQQR